MIAQSKICEKNGSGISAGHKGDKFKLAGGRVSSDANAKPSPLGGHQGGAGEMLGRPYAPGSWKDLLCEAYAGPHDALNSGYWYNEFGNIRSGMNSLQVGFGNVLNYSNVFLATPFAIADCAPSYLVPSITQ